MESCKRGPNRIFIKIIALILVHSFFLTSTCYPLPSVSELFKYKRPVYSFNNRNHRVNISSFNDMPYIYNPDIKDNINDLRAIVSFCKSKFKEDFNELVRKGEKEGWLNKDLLSEMDVYGFTDNFVAIEVALGLLVGLEKGITPDEENIRKMFKKKFRKAIRDGESINIKNIGEGWYVSYGSTTLFVKAGAISRVDSIPSKDIISSFSIASNETRTRPDQLVVSARPSQAGQEIDLSGIIQRTGQNAFKDILIKALSPYLNYSEDYDERFFTEAIKKLTSYRSFSKLYSGIGDQGGQLIDIALPGLMREKIKNDNIVLTVKSIGVGGEGHALYETANKIIDYLKKNDLYSSAEQGKIKIRLIGYDINLANLSEVSGKIDRQFEGLDPVWRNCIEKEFIYADLTDENAYKVLFEEKADLLFCRSTWVASTSRWTKDRAENIRDLLESNVNDLGVSYISGLGGAGYAYLDRGRIIAPKYTKIDKLEDSTFINEFEFKGEAIVEKEVEIKSPQKQAGVSFVDYIKTNNYTSIIDIGTGKNAGFLYKLRTSGLSGVELYGIAPGMDTETIETAKNINIVLNDLSYEKLGKLNKKFDVITINAPDYQYDIDNFLNILKSCLSPNGIIILRADDFKRDISEKKNVTENLFKNTIKLHHSDLKIVDVNLDMKELTTDFPLRDPIVIKLALSLIDQAYDTAMEKGNLEEALNLAVKALSSEEDINIKTASELLGGLMDGLQGEKRDISESLLEIVKTYGGDNVRRKKEVERYLQKQEDIKKTLKPIRDMLGDVKFLKIYIALRSMEHAGTVYDIKGLLGTGIRNSVETSRVGKKLNAEIMKGLMAIMAEADRIVKANSDLNNEEAIPIDLNKELEEGIEEKWLNSLESILKRVKDLYAQCEELEKKCSPNSIELESIQDVGKPINEIIEILEERLAWIQGEGDLKKELLDLNAVISNIVAKIKQGFKNPELEVSLDLSTIPVTEANKRMIECLISNILTNNDQLSKTMDITHIGIRTRLSDDGKNIILQVSDNGLGFPEEGLEQSSKKAFFTQRKGGTGLGLTENELYAREHNGTIQIGRGILDFMTKDPANNGTTFTITLPIEGKQQPAQTPQPVPEEINQQNVDNDKSTQAQKTILLVDDKESHLISYKYELEQSGYKVVTAISAKNALDISKTQNFDMVVTDLNLGGPDGLSLASDLKSEGFNGPILVQTPADVGHLNKNLAKRKDQAIENGNIVDFIEKPASIFTGIQEASSLSAIIERYTKADAEREIMQPDITLAAADEANKRITQSDVHNAIEENLPEDLKDFQNMTSEEQKKIKEKYRDSDGQIVIPIEELLLNTGLLGHIGLGQFYGEPVIYIDAQFKGRDRRDIKKHEKFEIFKWENGRKQLGLDHDQMRKWIVQNSNTDGNGKAQLLASQWHNQAPSVNHIYNRLAKQPQYQKSISSVPKSESGYIEDTYTTGSVYQDNHESQGKNVSAKEEDIKRYCKKYPAMEKMFKQAFIEKNIDILAKAESREFSVGDASDLFGDRYDNSLPDLISQGYTIDFIDKHLSDIIDIVINSETNGIEEMKNFSYLIDHFAESWISSHWDGIVKLIRNGNNYVGNRLARLIGEYGLTTFTRSWLDDNWDAIVAIGTDIEDELVFLKGACGIPWLNANLPILASGNASEIKAIKDKIINGKAGVTLSDTKQSGVLSIIDDIVNKRKIAPIEAGQTREQKTINDVVNIVRSLRPAIPKNGSISAMQYEGYIKALTKDLGIGYALKREGAIGVIKNLYREIKTGERARPDLLLWEEYLFRPFFSQQPRVKYKDFNRNLEVIMPGKTVFITPFLSAIAIMIGSGSVFGPLIGPLVALPITFMYMLTAIKGLATSFTNENSSMRHELNHAYVSCIMKKLSQEGLLADLKDGDKKLGPDDGFSNLPVNYPITNENLEQIENHVVRQLYDLPTPITTPDVVLAAGIQKRPDSQGFTGEVYKKLIDHIPSGYFDYNEKGLGVLLKSLGRTAEPTESAAANRVYKSMLNNIEKGISKAEELDDKTVLNQLNKKYKKFLNSEGLEKIEDITRNARSREGFYELLNTSLTSMSTSLELDPEELTQSGKAEEYYRNIQENAYRFRVLSRAYDILSLKGPFELTTDSGKIYYTLDETTDKEEMLGIVENLSDPEGELDDHGFRSGWRGDIKYTKNAAMVIAKSSDGKSIGVALYHKDDFMFMQDRAKKGDYTSSVYMVDFGYVLKDFRKNGLVSNDLKTKIYERALLDSGIGARSDSRIMLIKPANKDMYDGWKKNNYTVETFYSRDLSPEDQWQQSYRVIYRGVGESNLTQAKNRVVISGTKRERPSVATFANLSMGELTILSSEKNEDRANFTKSIVNWLNNGKPKHFSSRVWYASVAGAIGENYIVRLGSVDNPLALAHVTKRTGILSGFGKKDFYEISLVEVSEEFRGQGILGRIVDKVVNEIAKGELVVAYPDNDDARHAFEKIPGGFPVTWQESPYRDEEGNLWADVECFAFQNQGLAGDITVTQIPANFSMQPKNTDHSFSKDGSVDNTKFTVNGKTYTIDSTLDPKDIGVQIGEDIPIITQKGVNITFTIRGPTNKQAVVEVLTPQLLANAIARSKKMYPEGNPANQIITIVLADQYDYIAGDDVQNGIIIFNASVIEDMINNGENNAFIDEFLTAVLEEEDSHECGAPRDMETEMFLDGRGADLTMQNLNDKKLSLKGYINFVSRYASDAKNNNYLAQLKNDSDITLDLTLEEITRMRQIHSDHQIRVYDKLMDGLEINLGGLEADLYMSGSRNIRQYNLSLLRPTQGYLYQTKLDIQSIKTKIRNKYGLFMTPVVILDFGKDGKFIADGHHRYQEALATGETSIEAYTISFDWNDYDIWPQKMKDFYDDCKLRAESVENNGFNVMPNSTTWDFLFYNMMYHIPVIIDTLISDVHLLDEYSAEKFLDAAYHALSGKDSLWIEYDLARAIAELKLTDRKEEIVISKESFDRAVTELNLEESNGTITLKSGVIFKRGEIETPSVNANSTIQGAEEPELINNNAIGKGLTGEVTVSQNEEDETVTFSDKFGTTITLNTYETLAQDVIQNNLDIDLTNVKLTESERGHVDQILASSKNVKNIVKMQDDKGIRGYLDTKTGTLYLSEIFFNQDGAIDQIAIFHELGEGALVSTPDNINTHTYLRGAGKNLRKALAFQVRWGHIKNEASIEEAIGTLKTYMEKQFSLFPVSLSPMEPEEEKLIRYNYANGSRGNELAYGLQDKVFGERANFEFTEEIRRYYDPDFLKGLDIEGVKEYIKNKGVDLIDNSNGITLPVLKNIAFVLGLVPKEHLPNKITLKEQYDPAGGKGYITYLSMLGITKNIVCEGNAYGDTAFTTVHEIGHIAASTRKYMDFYEISWGNAVSLPLDNSQFLNSYAAQNKNEDFAEAYVYYVMKGNEFRAMASSSDIVQQKYAYMKEYVFNGVEYGGEVTTVEIQDQTQLATDEEVEAFCKQYPGMKQNFGTTFIKSNYYNLVELGESSGENASFLFEDGLPALKNSFGIGWIDKNWATLVELGESSGENSWHLFQYGLLTLKDIITETNLRSIGNDLAELGESSGKNVSFFFQYSLPALKNSFGIGWIDKNWATLVELGKSSGKNARYLFEDGLPVLKDIITETNLRSIGNDLAELGKSSGENARLLFQY
ncbi:MAG: ATP-binding protein, partial [Candidatus Omnitrophota bacterium]